MGSRNQIFRPIILSGPYIELGSNIIIRNGARIEAVYKYLGVKYSPLIIIGDNVTIEQNLHLTCATGIEIKKNTSIAANVTITDICHPYLNINLAPDKQLIDSQNVVIGEDSKIYNNVVITPGVKIGKHCVIGANSVVTNDVPDYCVAVGAPAKVIKKYNFGTQSWEKVV